MLLKSPRIHSKCNMQHDVYTQYQQRPKPIPFVYTQLFIFRHYCLVVRCDDICKILHRSFDWARFDFSWTLSANYLKFTRRDITSGHGRCLPIIWCEFDPRFGHITCVIIWSWNDVYGHSLFACVQRNAVFCYVQLILNSALHYRNCVSR